MFTQDENLNISKTTARRCLGLVEDYINSKKDGLTISRDRNGVYKLTLESDFENRSLKK